ncbi:hypothetical protein LOTGIDRAFT_176607, partial [Lottia gigantea]
WNDLGFHNPDILSPTLDRFAHDGVILNNSYMQPMCTPSRAAFLSGYYPFHTGIQHYVIDYWQPNYLTPNVTLLPQHLKQQGYSTHMVGKYGTLFIMKIHNLFTERAVDIINNHDATKPLFLYLPFQNVHFPVEVPKQYENMYSHIKDNDRRIYSGMVSAMDEAFKNVTDALEAKGLADNLILAFTAD